MKKTWKSPDCRQPVGKLAVLAIDERSEVRQGFENRFATQLVNRGSPAVVTYDQLSLAQIKDNKNAAAERFRSSGAEALLILRLTDVSGSYRETQPGGERYAGTITGFDTMGWYDYYAVGFSVGFVSMSPTYGNLKQQVYLETRLYDLKTEKPLWSGVTLTVVKETTDRVDEADSLVKKILDAMRKDGVIR